MPAIASVLNRLGHSLGQWLHGTFFVKWLDLGSQSSKPTLRLGDQATDITRLIALSMSLSCIAGVTGCHSGQSSPPPRYISLQQTWELQPGTPSQVI